MDFEKNGDRTFFHVTVQTELVELSDPSAQSNDEDTLAQTPPKKKAKLAKRHCVFRSE